MRRIYILVFGICFLMLAGCSKSPMEKLASDVVYSDMNNVFWGKEQDTKTKLWDEALTYCKKNAEKPNCNPVLFVSTMSSGNKTLIPLNSNPLNKPNFK